jgi:hypothetical protein
MTNLRVAVVLFLAMLAAAAWLTLRDAAAPALPPADAAPMAASDPVAAASAATAPAADAPDAAAPERTTAALPADAPRPLPADAPWVEVLVVDGASDAPVADAEVHWIDQSAATLVQEQLGEAAAFALGWQPIEATAARAGWRTRSDAQGRARVTVLDTTEVAAAHGGRYGTLALRANTVTPSLGHRLRLQPDRALQVRVTDAAGAPIADVPVTVGARNGLGNPIGRYSWQPRARTGGDGLATIPHLQLVEDAFRRATADPKEEPPPYAHFAKICLPGCDDVSADFDLAAPVQPIQLRLPAHGSLRVRAELLGQSLPDFRSVGLSEEFDPKAPDAQSWQRRQMRSDRTVAVGDDGFARFPHVPLGKRWTVWANAAGVKDAVAGPTAPDQEVTVVLTPNQARCVGRGRALAAAGAPLRSMELRVQAQWAKDRADVAVTTDDDGRFVVSLRTQRDAAATATVTIATIQGEAMPRRIELRDQRLVAGVLDRGDLVLDEWPVLVRGRLTRDGAPCAGPCTFEIQREEHTVGKNARWRGVENVVGRVAPDGSFAVYGDPAPGPHRLRARTPDGAQSELVDFQPGARSLAVDLVARHPLAASALLPAGARRQFANFDLVAVAPPQFDQAGAPKRSRRVPEGESAPHVDVRWPSLPAGRYELRVAVDTQPTPLLVIPDVVVPAPPGGDPRLREIDLCALLRVVTIVLHGADGARLADPYGLVAPNAPPATGPLRGQPIWGADTTLLLPAGPYDLTLYVQGFRPHPLRGDAERVEARLEPWPVVELRFGDVPALPEGVTLHARLVPTAPPSMVRIESMWQSGQLDDFARVPSQWRRARDGVARVPVGDGPHRLEVRLQRRGGEMRIVDGAFVEVGGGFAPIADAAPATVTWNGAPVAATAPAAAWQTAIAALAEPAKPQGATTGGGR